MRTSRKYFCCFEITKLLRFFSALPEYTKHRNVFFKNEYTIETLFFLLISKHLLDNNRFSHLLENDLGRIHFEKYKSFMRSNFEWI